MLLLALHLATAAVTLPPPEPHAPVTALPDGGTRRRGGGRDDEDRR